MRRILLAFVACQLLLGSWIGPAPVRADSWAMPEVAVFTSANGQFRLTVTPARIGSQLEYFQDRVAEDEGRKAPPDTTAMATLERKIPDGGWTVLWLAPLRNRVAPVSALVSDDGQRVVTFDDWHAVGTGENVVAIYDAKGAVVQSYTLAELLPDFYVSALERSVSSIRWARVRRIDEERGLLVIAIAKPAGDAAEVFDQADSALIEGGSDPRGGKVPRTGGLALEIALNDGAVRPLTGENWDAAFAAARQSNAKAAELQAQRVRFLTEPLQGPSENTQGAWHDYLEEAFYRLTPNYLEGDFTSTTVLRDPEADDYQASENWVLEKFADAAEFGDGNIAIASVGSPDKLVQVLRKASESVPAGSMGKATIYLAIPASHQAAAEAVVARTGAKFVWLDPATPIPQRPERIPGSPEEAAANEIIQRSMIGAAQDAARTAADAMH